MNPNPAKTYPEKLYRGITAEKWEEIRETAANRGLSLSNRAGSQTFMGCTFRWSYFEQSETLLIVIVSTGMFSLSQVQNYLDGMINGA